MGIGTLPVSVIFGENFIEERSSLDDLFLDEASLNRETSPCTAFSFLFERGG